MEKDVILRLLEPFTDGKSTVNNGKMITKVDFFTDKLTGCEGASENRARLCRECGLPEDMTPNALLEAVKILVSYDEFIEIAKKIK